jgi:hypothetical protein
MIGHVVGGWGYVWAAWIISWVGLGAYAFSVTRKKNG